MPMPMPDRGTGTTAIAIVLLLAIVGATSSAKLSREQAGSVISILEGGKGQSQELRDVLQSMTRSDPCDRVEATLAAALPAGRKPRLPVQFIIATVPDPIDSQLSYIFDRNIDIIQRSFSTNKYSLDRFWLPWAHDLSKARNEDEVCRTRAPGIMVFRSGSGDSTRFVVVLLVGEAPTFGVQRTQLAKALDFIWKHGDRSKIHLIGPNFS